MKYWTNKWIQVDRIINIWKIQQIKVTKLRLLQLDIFIKNRSSKTEMYKTSSLLYSLNYQYSDIHTPYQWVFISIPASKYWLLGDSYANTHRKRQWCSPPNLWNDWNLDWQKTHWAHTCVYNHSIREYNGNKCGEKVRQRKNPFRHRNTGYC